MVKIRCSKVLAFIMAVLMCFSSIGFNYAFAESKIVIAVDGVEIKFTDAEPFFDSNSRTLAPVRTMGEALGGTVSWDGNTETAMVTKANIVVKIVLGQNIIKVNNKNVEMDTTAISKEGRIFIPVRYLAEALGGSVSYNSSLKRIEIVTQQLNLADLITQIYEKNYKELSIMQQGALSNVFRDIEGKLDKDPIGHLSTAYMSLVIDKTEPKAQVALTAWSAKKHPDSVTLLNNLGFALSTIKDYSNAIEILKRTLVIEMESLETIINLGNIYLDNDRDEEAKAEYERALKIDENHFKAWEGLYAYYMKKKDFNKAMEIAAKIMPIGFRQSGKQKIQKDLDDVPEDEKLEQVKDGEDIDSGQKKIEKLAQKKPITLAPMIEEISSEMAAKIRDEMENLKVTVVVPDNPFVFDYNNLEQYYILTNAYAGRTVTSDEANELNIDPSILDLANRIGSLSESEIDIMVNEYVGGIQDIMKKYENMDFNNIEQLTKAIRDIELASSKDIFEKIRPQGDAAKTLEQLGAQEKKGTVTSSNYSNYTAHKRDILLHFKNLIIKFEEKRESMKESFQNEMKDLLSKQSNHDDGRADCEQCIGQRNKLRQKYLTEFGNFTTDFYRKYVKPTIEKVENSQALYIKNMGNKKLKNMEGEQLKAEMNAFLNAFAKAEAPIDTFEVYGSQAARQLEEKIAQVKEQAPKEGEPLPPLKNYEDKQRSLLEKIYEDTKFEGNAGLAKLTYENAELTLSLSNPISNEYMDLGASLKDLSVSLTEGEGYEVGFKVAQKAVGTDVEAIEAEVGYSNKGVGRKTTLFFDDNLNVSDVSKTTVPGSQGVSSQVSIFGAGVEGTAKIETTAEGSSSFVTGLKAAYNDFQIWEKQYKEELNP